MGATRLTERAPAGTSGSAGAGGSSAGAGGSTDELCGNGVLDADEACDGTPGAIETCATITMNARPDGDLTCGADCQFDASGCRTRGGVGETPPDSGPMDPEACRAAIPNFDPACASCVCDACTQAMQDCSADPGCVAIRTCAQKALCSPYCFYVPNGDYNAAPCYAVLNENGGPNAPSGSLFLAVWDCQTGASCACFDPQFACQCDGDALVTCSDGTVSSCQPYRCTSQSACVTSCQSDGDCAYGFHCAADGTCQ